MGEASLEPLLPGSPTAQSALPTSILGSLGAQAALAVPMVFNLVPQQVLASLNLVFVAKGGTEVLAAAALGSSIAGMLKLVLLGLCGALDTQANQAVGAGKTQRLPYLYQRTALFLTAHCAPLSLLLLAAPRLLLLRLLLLGGCDAVFLSYVEQFMVCCLPSLFLDSLSRPLSRILVAQRACGALAVIALLEVPINAAVNYLLVVHLRLLHVGAALSLTFAAALDLMLLLCYLVASGRARTVLAWPSARALRGWGRLARLSYPAAVMKCSESWAFNICTLAAAVLPNAKVAVAAVGVAYSVYGVLFVTFVAFSMAACVQVGAGLGAGNGHAARVAAIAAVCIAPLAWALAAAALLLPSSQDLLIRLFSPPAPSDASAPLQPPLPLSLLPLRLGSSSSSSSSPSFLSSWFWQAFTRVLPAPWDAQPPQSGWGHHRPGPSSSGALAAWVVEPDPGEPSHSDGPEGAASGPLAVCLHRMLALVALLILFDGVQTILSGVVQALGLQRWGAAVNAVAFYVVAVPAALALAFGAGLCAEGLYLGMVAGPVIQTACYTLMLACLDWDLQARLAVAASWESVQNLNLLESLHSDSTEGLNRHCTEATGPVKFFLGDPDMLVIIPGSGV